MADKLRDAAQEVVQTRDRLIEDDVRVPMSLSLAIDRLKAAVEASDRPSAEFEHNKGGFLHKLFVRS